MLDKLVYSLHAWVVAGGPMDGDAGAGLVGAFACRAFGCVFVLTDI